MDLPVWQALRTQLHSKGVEIVTVALDTAGAEAAARGSRRPLLSTHH